MQENERYELMTRTPVAKLIPRMAVPTVISMLVTSIYNLADTFFVSKIDTGASAAVGVVFSLMALIQAVGFALGMGSGNCVSRLLGAKEEKRAEQVASVAFFTALIIGIAVAGIGLCSPHALVRLLGANEEVREYSADYVVYILIAAPFMMSSFVMNNQLRAQGYALYSMIGLATGGVLNMVLDPAFIVIWGVAGAGIATMLSQMVSFLILFVLTALVRGVIRIRPAAFRPSGQVYLQIMHSGLPSFARQSLSSLSGVVLNYVAGGMSTAALAAMTIVSRVMMFIYSALIGFAQGFQPVCGFNYGAKRYDRVLESYYFCQKVALVLLTALGAVFFAFAPFVVGLFRDDAQVIHYGTLALRFQCASLPLQSFIMMIQFLTQSIGYGVRASVVAMGRQGLFLIPLYLTLPRFFGEIGLVSAQFFSDLFTFVLALCIMKGVLSTLKELKNSCCKETQE